MSSSLLKKHPILTEATLEILEEIEYEEIVLETFVVVSENRKQIIELILVGDLIMLYKKENGQSTPLAYIRINFSLKFERIFERKTLFERQLKGFRLANDFREEITFLFQDPLVGPQWMPYLSNLLNETEFQNNYRPIRTLGKGSSATVYEIARIDDGRRFATKVLSKEILKKNIMRMKNFMNQLEILRSIEHKNLLSFLGAYQSETSFYVIMETLHGGNMHEYLTNRKQFLSTNQIKSIMRCILSGLSYLQQLGVVHRDIKLSNLMIKDQNSIQPVIVDFGLAVYEDDLDYHYVCGTPGFISPQVLSQKEGKRLTPKSDVFSAGAVLHILLTGKYLFSGTNPEQVMHNNVKMNFNLDGQQYSKTDPELHDLLRKMLEKDPEMRLSASQCLQHSSLQPISYQHEYWHPLSPSATNIDYHF